MLLCRDVELGELGMEPGRPAPSQVDLPIDDSCCSPKLLGTDDGDALVPLKPVRQWVAVDWLASEAEDQQEERRRQLEEDWERGSGEHGWTRTGRRGSWRTRISGGGGGGGRRRALHHL